MAANGLAAVGGEDEVLSSSSEDEPPSQTISHEQKQITNLSQKLPKLMNIFNVHRIIGEGSYSSVFLASLKCDSHIPDERKKFFAIKHLIPISHPDRIEHELRCLKYIGGCDNVVGVDLCLRQSNAVVFIMPYLPHTKFSDYFQKMDLMEIRLYMKNLLLALKRVHQFNIIHRDVKPSNFLYDRINKRYLLVDFGLAQKVYYGPPKIKAKTINQTDTIQQAATIIQQSDLVKKRKFEELNDGKDAIEMTSKKVSLTGCFLNTSNLPLKPLQRNDPKYSPAKSTYLSRPQVELSRIDAVKRQVLNDDNENGSEKKKPIFLEPRRIIAHSSVIRHDTSKMNFKPKGSAINTCRCYGLPAVCSICLNRQPYKASRSGTQGFRPPEVLLKYTDQTTAVDIWASGVILLSFLSGCYPFFRGSDDLAALAEHVTLFGSSQLKRVAHILGRHLTCSNSNKPINLRKLCEYLQCRNKKTDKSETQNSTINGACRKNIKLPSQNELLKKSINHIDDNLVNKGCENDNHSVLEKFKPHNEHNISFNNNQSTSLSNQEMSTDKNFLYKQISQNSNICDECALTADICICLNIDNKVNSTSTSVIDKQKSWAGFPDEAFDLLEKLLDINPFTRISASEALNHPFLLDIN